MFMQRKEPIVIKIAQPTQNKRFWLESLAQAFSAAVQLCLDEAQNLRTSSRAKIHKASYYRVRESFGLPSDYARMAVNACVSLAGSYYGRRKVQKHPSFPKANGAQGIGLGVASYAIAENNGRWF